MDSEGILKADWSESKLADLMTLTSRSQPDCTTSKALSKLKKYPDARVLDWSVAVQHPRIALVGAQLVATTAKTVKGVGEIILPACGIEVWLS